MMADLLQVVEAATDCFESLNLAYALGGAIANTYWGIVRTTQDLDCLVQVPALRYQSLVDELSRRGFTSQDESGGQSPLSVASIREQERALHFFEVYLGGTRVQIFTPFLRLQTEALRRAVRMPLGSRTVFVTSAEDLVLLKMAFHRQKDLIDVRGILQVQRGKLDLDYLRRWGAAMLSDESLQELEGWIGETEEQRRGNGD